MMIQVQAFSRLHFGLMEISPGQPHCYGGVGMMITSPAMFVRGRSGSVPDPSWVEIHGDAYWCERTRRVLDLWHHHRNGEPIPLQSIAVVAPPKPHIGLGSGTQWACSIAGLLELAKTAAASSIAVESTWNGLFASAELLANHAGRGLRSHIGCEGFRCGGLIVDWGQGAIGERTQVKTFPEDWRMVTWCDRSYQGESGGSEAMMFDRCSSRPNPNRRAMLRMIVEEMMPAFDASDWITASDAIGRYGEQAGRIFAPWQGGVYRSPAIAECITHLRDQGIHGVGQSSWGPTVFALARDEDQAHWIAEFLASRPSDGAVIDMAEVAPAAVYACDSSS